ncbi:MAG: hypothetical protein K2Q01_11840 [Rickettsiales bacterium]|nr:hypothetical protein [Rickettsiales bacterium]
MHVLPQLIESLVADGKPMAIKKETEAEGASAEDIFLFRALTWRVKLPFYVKIGGAEAVTDVALCQRAQVDGIIAPMIESHFALQKFLNSIDAVYGAGVRPRLIITIESQTAVRQFDAIFSACKGHVQDITIGRTDLSASFMDAHVTPACAAVMEMVQEVAARVAGSGIELNMGGNVNVATPGQLAGLPGLLGQMQSIETRNVIFAAKATPAQIAAALHFEKGWLEYKAQMQQAQLNGVRQRLAKISERL